MLILLVGVSVITRVDRTPYRLTNYYKKTMIGLDSVETSSLKHQRDSLLIGWSRVNITPSYTMPMAGYGARDPKEFESIKDSIYIKTIVLQQGAQKVSIVTADLLLIHPEVDKYLTQHLPEGWNRDEIYFTASHTHSSRGGYAPGIIGELLAGEYEPKEVKNIAQSILESIKLAEAEMSFGTMNFGEIMVDDLVKNRLVKEKGIIDPWFKILALNKDTLTGYLNVYSSHATTLKQENRNISGDYPGVFVSMLESDSTVDFAAFASGAVGSMSPVKGYAEPEKNTQFLAQQLAQQHKLLRLLSGARQSMEVDLYSYRVPLHLPEPAIKISSDWALRPYLFKSLLGNYESEVSVLILGKVLLVGLPVELSGELAVPLYDYAKSLGLNLIITCFNGDYGGYVVKDEWYDLNKYESRTMSWYGPFAGSYISEVISKLILISHENHKTNTSR